MADSLRGLLYWPLRHLGEWVRARFRARPIRSSIVTLVLIIWAYAWRPMWESTALTIRKDLFVIIFATFFAFLAYRIFRAGYKRGIVRSLVHTLAALALIAGAIYYGQVMHDYGSLYVRYITLPKQELTSLPVSSHERVQPLNAVSSVAHEVMNNNTEAPTLPDFVRDPDGTYRFTLAVEPSTWFPRIFTPVIDSVFSIPGTAPAVSFGAEHRVRVEFDVGEDLYFSHNMHSCVVRAFGPARYWSYEPTRPIYMKDDAGEMVAVVPLVHWEGLLFPRPEFGGVQVVRQQTGGFVRFLERIFLGCGDWVPPEEIGKHAFLKGQNLMPQQVSRYYVESFRFHNGFFAPLPGYHVGDMRITDLEGDQNDQPFVSYFTHEGQTEGKLDHYFSLEPYNPERQGLSMSLFVPGDGVGPVLYYDHARRDELLIGVSAVAPKVMSTRRQYDWTVNRPVENRPFIRDIGGSRRFFWITTVVTVDSSGRRFTAGTTPEVAITDADSSSTAVVWVDPAADPNWATSVEQSLAKAVSQ